MKSALRSCLTLGYGAIGAMRNGAIALIVGISASFAAPVTVVALGDSLTQGYGLPVEQGFVPQMQAWLQGNGAEANLINAGVSGDTTAGGAARLDWSLSGEVDALIVNLGGNDLLRGLDPQVSRDNLVKIMEGAKARNLPVLLVGLQASTNYGPDFQTRFDAIFSDLAAEYETLLLPSYFAPLLLADGSRLDPRLMQGDGIHPNAEGVALIVAAMGPYVQQLLQKVVPK